MAVPQKSTSASIRPPSLVTVSGMIVMLMGCKMSMNPGCQKSRLHCMLLRLRHPSSRQRPMRMATIPLQTSCQAHTSCKCIFRMAGMRVHATRGLILLIAISIPQGLQPFSQCCRMMNNVCGMPDSIRHGVSTCLSSSKGTIEGKESFCNWESLWGAVTYFHVKPHANHVGREVFLCLGRL